MTSVLVISLFLPPIANPRLQNEVVEISELQKNTSTDVRENKLSFFKDIKHKLLIFKENRTVLVWSLWWALASCGTFQVC